MKLLVIDDNYALIRSLRDFLGKEFIIDATKTAREGLQLAISSTCDIIVLDISLPDGTGTDVCREIRAAKIRTPIIILSASNTVQSRVTLLNLGADDYLAKPFSLLELRARLFALMRRVPDHSSNTILSVADLEVDISSRQVTRDGQEVSLRRKEFDILEYLVRNAGQTVTRTMILDHVWEHDMDRGHNTVDVHIKHLRDKVDRPFSKPLIKTTYGIGYILSTTSGNDIRQSGGYY